MIKLSFITDEATQDFDEALSFAVENGLDALELRSVNDTPIDLISPDTLREWKKKLDAHHIAVCSLASTFYKCRANELEGQLEKLSRLCDACDILGCDTIRGFTFFAEEDGPKITDEILAQFQEPLALLQKRNKRLLLEADPSVNTTNHAALAEFLKRLDAPLVGAIYDPGNDIYDPAGETPYPDGYEAIRPYLSHIHIKDAVKTEGEPVCVKIGQGLVGYEALLPRLLKDGYDGYLSLETHYRVNQVLSEEQMRLPQGSSFSAGGMEATHESLLALRTLLEEAKASLSDKNC